VSSTPIFPNVLILFFPIMISIISFNDFFGITYPLPKLDMVAIPEFAAGAMENWGLVTYRDGKQYDNVAICRHYDCY